MRDVRRGIGDVIFENSIGFTIYIIQKTWKHKNMILVWAIFRSYGSSKYL